MSSSGEKRHQKVAIDSWNHGKTLLTRTDRALLEAIATKLATSIDSIDDYTRRTLLFHSVDHSQLLEMVLSTVQELRETGLIEENIGSK